MDRYRSPQTYTASPLQISSPRSLRPREDRRLDPTIRYAPAAASRQPVIPVQLSQGVPVYRDNGAYAPTQEDSEPGESAPSEGGYWSETTSPKDEGRSFVGGFWTGLRSIPQALGKHYSRHSLYAEYLAEAEAASRTASPRHHYASTVLSDIPENTTDAGFSDRSPYPLPRPHPTFPPAGSSIDFTRTGGIGSPVYAASALISNYSKEASTDIPLPPEDTWAYYIHRIQLVINYVYNLPWSSPRIVSDYIPARDGRAPRRKAKMSWYAPRGAAPRNTEKPEEPVSPSPPLPELLVMPPTPNLGIAASQFTAASGELPPPNIPYGANGSVYSSGAVTAVRPIQSPMTTTSVGYGFPSPGASSHGQNRHAASYSWYYTSPPVYQPFPLGQFFQDATSTPYTRTEQSLGFTSP